LRREDVEDDVEVVGEDPRALLDAVDGARQEVVLLLHPPVHLVPDRRRLTRVPPGADDEEVGERADGPHVENQDVLRQLLLGESGDPASMFERRQLNPVYPGRTEVNRRRTAPALRSDGRRRPARALRGTRRGGRGRASPL